MPGWFPEFLSGHHIERGWHGLLLVLASLLELAACAGLGYVAGFGHLRTVLAHFSWPWPWLLVPPAAWSLSYAGYFFSYRGIFRVQAGPEMRRR